MSTLEKFKQVLLESTGYYYPNDRAQYLLDKISKDAASLTRWLDNMPIEGTKIVVGALADVVNAPD